MVVLEPFKEKASEEKLETDPRDNGRKYLQFEFTSSHAKELNTIVTTYNVETIKCPIFVRVNKKQSRCEDFNES